MKGQTEDVGESLDLSSGILNQFCWVKRAVKGDSMVLGLNQQKTGIFFSRTEEGCGRSRLGGRR